MSRQSDPGAAVWVSDEVMTGGTIGRRIAAFLIDGVILLIVCKALLALLLVFGVLTLGLGLPLLALLPIVPVLYNWLAIASSLSATPGQALLGLAVRRNDDLGPPGGFAALIFVLGFYVSLALSGLPLLLALFTARRRTFHDFAAGVVVVRSRALTEALGLENMRPGGPPYA